METKGKQYLFTTIETNSNLPPQFSEFPTKDWVPFGESNDYPDYLVELFNRSSTHNAIIKGKHKYICGQGWLFNAELPPDQQTKAQEFIDSCNNFGQSLYDVTTPAVLDWLIYGGFTFKGKYGVLTRKPEHLYYKDFSRFRISRNEEKFFESGYWVFEKNGQHVRQPRTPKDVTEINRFQYDKVRGEGLIYYRDPRPQMKFYPMPEYIGCVQDVETEVSIAEFHNNNVKSGFSAGFIIEFTNGVPEKDEKDKIIKELKEQYTGAINSGELFVTFADSKDRGVVVTPIRPNDMDKQFEVLRRDINQSIITNHSITSPMLMAIKTEGQLGGRTEMLDAAELFQNTYVAHKQKVIASVINKWFTAKYGFDAGLYIQKLEPVKQNLNLSAVMDQMTDAEIREYAGLPPLTPEQEQEMEAKKKEQAEQNKPLKFSAEYSTFLNKLKSCACEDGEIIAKRDGQFETYDYSIEAEQAFLEKYRMHDSYQKFAGLYDLPYYQHAIYNFLDKNKGKHTIKSISEKLTIAEPVVLLTLNKLQEQNYLNWKFLKDGVIDFIRVNPISDAPGDMPNVPVYELVTRWIYDGPLDDRTREFCRHMMEDEGLQGKMWKREDIDKLSISEGRNVWLTRGGWYTLPNGNKRPSCRHFWKQVIVKVKAGTTQLLN